MSVIGNSFDLDDPLPEPKSGGYVSLGIPPNATFDQIADALRRRREHEGSTVADMKDYKKKKKKD